MISLETDFRLSFDFEKSLHVDEDEHQPKEICKFYLKGHCLKGTECPYRHIKPEKAVVCKHWLRGLCKKGDKCEFLHEYDPKKMPECWFFSNYGECSNPECIFRHIKPEVKTCAWYDRGFCRHGPKCKNKHQFKIACPDYLAGFCIQGPNCKFAHPKFDIPKEDPQQKKVIPPQQVVPPKPISLQEQRPQQKQYRPLNEVTCFKCRQKGHYANKCPLRGKRNIDMMMG